MGLRVGLEAKLYRNTGTAGSASPTLNEVGNCRDLTLGMEKNTTDVTVRANNGWRANKGVLKDGTIEWSMIADGEDADYVAFRDAFLNNTDVDIFVMSSDVDNADSEGLRAVVSINNFTRNEPLEEALTVDITAQPTYFPAMPPHWVTGSTYGAYD
jgi:hypothetical protein